MCKINMRNIYIGKKYNTCLKYKFMKNINFEHLARRNITHLYSEYRELLLK